MNHEIAIPEIKVVVGRADLGELTTTAEAFATLVYDNGVDTEDECATAREYMVKTNALVKEIEDQRTTAKKPFLETGKKIDALAKKLSTPLETCVSKIKIKLAEYAMRVEVERQQVEAERLRLEAVALRDSDGRTPALVVELEIPRAAGVALTTLTDYHYDMDLLPKEYCLPNEQKIKHAIAAGIVIPGIRIEKRKTVRAS